MRLLVLTQVLDTDHPALGQTIDIVAALAQRCEEVVVLCDHAGRYTPPANVRLRTFGSSTRLGRGASFERAVAAETLRHNARADAVLAHMVPAFLILASPLCKALRIPIGLWYTHWNADRSLRLATRLADVVLSVDKRSFPLASPKVTGIGHAIDVSRFPLPRDPKPRGGPLRLLALGRMTHWKGYTTMLAGIELATEQGLDVTLEIRGPALTTSEREHLAELEQTVSASTNLRERVSIEPPVAREAIPGAPRRCGRAHQRDAAGRERDTGQGRVRGERGRIAGSVEQCRLGRVSRRSTAAAALRAPRSRRSGAPSVRNRGGQPRPPSRDGARTPATRRSRALRRLVGRCRDPRARGGWAKTPSSPEYDLTVTANAVPPVPPPVAPAPPAREPRDIRSSRPRLLTRASLARGGRRLVGVAALIALDVAGLALGLMAALVIRTIVYGSPVFWSILWSAGAAEWLPFLAPITVLVFLQAGLYAPRERRSGAGRIVSSLVLVALIVLAFGIGTSYDFTSSGLIPTAVVTCAVAIGLLRAAYDSAAPRAPQGLRCEEAHRSRRCGRGPAQAPARALGDATRRRL